MVRFSCRELSGLVVGELFRSYFAFKFLVKVTFFLYSVFTQVVAAQFCLLIVHSRCKICVCIDLCDCILCSTLLTLVFCALVIWQAYSRCENPEDVSCRLNVDLNFFDPLTSHRALLAPHVILDYLCMYMHCQLSMNAQCAGTKLTVKTQLGDM